MEQQEMAQIEQNNQDTTDIDSQEQKTYTKEEVSQMIQRRLARAKEGWEKGPDPKIVELEQREKALLARETLLDLEAPKELASIISFTDRTDLEEKVNTLKQLFSQNDKSENEDSKKTMGFQVIGAPSSDDRNKGYDPIRKAMKLK